MLDMAAVATLLVSMGAVDPPPILSTENGIMVAEAHRLVETVGDRLWPGWSDVPRPILLMTRETEFAIGFPEDLEGFETASEELGDRAVQWRKRTSEQTLAAAYPVMGHPAVVIGDADVLDLTPVEWTLTCAHEMFHVLQMHRNEFDKVASLGIGPKDDAGWQLTFPFPYDDDVVAKLMHVRAYPIYLAATGRDAAYAMSVAAEADDASRAHLLDATGDHRAYDYLRFQEWKEGVARYTEREMCRLAAQEGEAPPPEFRELAGDDAYAQHWEGAARAQIDVVKHVGRTARSRTGFYYSGMGLAYALDAALPDWRTHYFEAETWLDDLIRGR